MMIGILSCLLCLIILTISMVMVVTDNTWHMVMIKTDLWLQENRWDIKEESNVNWKFSQIQPVIIPYPTLPKKVDHAVWRCLDWVDRNHKKVLGTLMVTAILHLVFSVMLIFGTLLYRRSLLIPWMIFHMFSIILMVITFTCWTFFTFFISLLLAIVFPVVAGLLLGLWIVMWREVYHFFTSIMDSDTKLLVNINMQMQYQPVE